MYWLYQEQLEEPSEGNINTFILFKKKGLEGCETPAVCQSEKQYGADLIWLCTGCTSW